MVTNKGDWLAEAFLPTTVALHTLSTVLTAADNCQCGVVCQGWPGDSQLQARQADQTRQWQLTGTVLLWSRNVTQTWLASTLTLVTFVVTVANDGASTVLELFTRLDPKILLLL